MTLIERGASSLLGIGLLVAAATAPAVESAGEAAATAPATSPVARDSDMQTARRELERGRMHLHAGRFDRAQDAFQRAAETAPVNSSVAREAAEHAQFRLPIARAQRWLLTGQRARAEAVLREAMAANDAHPERVRQLNEMLANLSGLSGADAAQVEPLGLNNAVVVESARGVLENFRQRRGRYPVTKEEFTRVIGTAAAPLDAFEVVRSGGNGTGYLLVLRNRKDPVHVITIQKTGLLQ